MARTVQETTRLYDFYRQFRQHQRDVQASGGGMLSTYPGGCTELSYASAPYGEHALSAWASARRHAHFLRVNHPGRRAA